MMFLPTPVTAKSSGGSWRTLDREAPKWPIEAVEFQAVLVQVHCQASVVCEGHRRGSISRYQWMRCRQIEYRHHGMAARTGAGSGFERGPCEGLLHGEGRLQRGP